MLFWCSSTNLNISFFKYDFMLSAGEGWGLGFGRNIIYVVKKIPWVCVSVGTITHSWAKLPLIC